jgi:hypothetical protein
MLGCDGNEGGSAGESGHELPHSKKSFNGAQPNAAEPLATGIYPLFQRGSHAMEDARPVVHLRLAE